MNLLKKNTCIILVCFEFLGGPLKVKYSAVYCMVVQYIAVKVFTAPAVTIDSKVLLDCRLGQTGQQ